MKIENPAAFSFIMQDEIYLLKADKEHYSTRPLPAAEEEPVLVTPQVVFNYLGGNKKRFLIITHYPGLEFMDAAHLAPLESTLKRLGFEVDDTAVFNIAAHAGTSFKQLTDFFTPALLLILGKKALPADLNMAPFNKIQQAGDCRALYTYGFDEMMNSTENKKAFWEQMKQL